MPTLINTDNVGNVFENYLTPLIKGESGDAWNTTRINSYLTSLLGSANNFNLTGTSYYIRFPAPGLETKTGIVTSSANFRFATNTVNIAFGAFNNAIVTGNSNGNNQITAGFGFGGGPGTASSDIVFRTGNQYSMCQAVFTNTALTSLRTFYYAGWLREPQYTGNPYPRGFIILSTYGSHFFRATTENATGTTAIQSAADIITTPSITCSISTPGADTTDVIIRDSVSPNNAIGKLYNCVVLPAACVVGGIYKNNGIDPEGSNQDKFLCIMNWGTRKLGMRVWTEGFS